MGKEIMLTATKIGNSLSVVGRDSIPYQRFDALARSVDKRARLLTMGGRNTPGVGVMIERVYSVRDR